MKYRTDTIDLNIYIHNNNGAFAWNWLGIGFHATAKDVQGISIDFC